MDMLRTLLSLSPIGSSIVLQPHPDRFRTFDEKILLVGESLDHFTSFLMHIAGGQLKAGRGYVIVFHELPAFCCNLLLLFAATGWQPSTAFNDTVLSVLQYWRREVRARHHL